MKNKEAKDVGEFLGLHTPPPTTPYNFLSLGAGVQSSTLALMAAEGEIMPMPDAAIFADTQAEPKSVYDWLDWLEEQLPFPVYKVTKGSLTEDSLKIRTTKTDGRQYSKSLIPAYTIDKKGGTGILSRSCTADYKIQQLLKKQRMLAGIKRGQKECTVTSWIGISMDEIQRMKISREPWVQNRFPLIEKRVRRTDCKQWMKKHGYPEPPRSACVYCPFHSDKEWRRLKEEEPEEFERAVKFEKDLQDAHAQDPERRATCFLHPSRIPLDEIDFSKPNAGQMEIWNDFENECEGMCGL